MPSLPSAASALKERAAESPRHHDLDALRVMAMLLGIAYHSALSFSLGAGWVVQDIRQSKVLYIFQAFVHGFRMQLFMLLSGFFTAMLWRRRGWKGLLLNRLRRVLFPCIAGLFTVVPAVYWAGGCAVRGKDPAKEVTQLHPFGDLDIADPVSSGNVAWHTGGSWWKDERVSFSDAAPQDHIQVLPKQGGGTGKWLSQALGSILPGGLAGRCFVLVWFLWFLVWLTPLFSLYAAAAECFQWKLRPNKLLVSQRSLIWLVPLTVAPALRMDGGGSDFGPETSMGFLPAPHVLCYYAIFFGFGVLYSECGDTEGCLGRSWRLTLPLTLLVIFPMALEFASGVFGMRNGLLQGEGNRFESVSLQVIYAWMMCFASIGFFRTFMGHKNRWIRYAADASLWCYLAHLPLVILMQAFVCQWALPALLKWLFVFCSVSLGLFVSYEKGVRDRWIGTFLNGRRHPHVESSRKG